MTPWLLSIVIPTFNRAESLALLLSDLELVVAVTSNVQVVICNNCSTDDTASVIARHMALHPNSSRVIDRCVNLGMEGNIACSMMEGDGKFIWMLSDHQRLCVPEVQQMIGRLGTLEFDVGHAKLVQWSAILDRKETVIRWADIPLSQRGALLFTLGNISALMFRRDFGRVAAKSIFRSCRSSYPQLGLMTRLDDATRFVEFDALSSLPEGKLQSTFKQDYDTLLASFRDHVLCVRDIAQTTGITFSRRGFFTAEYRGAFLRTVLNFVLKRDISRLDSSRILGSVVMVNPPTLKLVGSAVLVAIVVLPHSWRISLATLLKNRYVRRAPDVLQ